MNTETVYNSGKNKDGAVMKKISKWDYLLLISGVGLTLLPFSLFFIDASTFTVVRLIIGSIIGMSLLTRFFKAYRESKENDNE